MGRMIERTPITEEQTEIWKDWFKLAKKQDMKSLPEFMRHVLNGYDHDYGTIIHAISACAIAAAWAADKSECGGITGFQAGFVMWDFIRYWSKNNNKVGLKLVDYDDMLFPQYQYRFEKTISPDTWKRLQEEANKNLENDLRSYPAHPAVLDHWHSIVDGKVPFGYTVSEDD